MPVKTKKQRKAKTDFELKVDEREILNELIIVLEWFEFVTDELQSNRVSISRVYPCVNYLQFNLKDKKGTFDHVDDFCESLLSSLERRFGKAIKNEVYVVSTFLDPNFGLDIFPPEEKPLVLKKLKIY